MSIYSYQKNKSPEITKDFEQADLYGKVRLGSDNLFWKKKLSWKYVPLDEIRRIYRRVEAVDTKMCCGNVNFDIQKLVLELKDGTSYEMVISEGVPREAEVLYKTLQEQRTEILYGKV
ncbi:MAG: hypothetical protein ACI4ES_14835 [Roseburia sp.]